MAAALKLKMVNTPDRSKDGFQPHSQQDLEWKTPSRWLEDGTSQREEIDKRNKKKVKKEKRRKKKVKRKEEKIGRLESRRAGWL